MWQLLLDNASEKDESKVERGSITFSENRWIIYSVMQEQNWQAALPCLAATVISRSENWV